MPSLGQTTACRGLSTGALRRGSVSLRCRSSRLTGGRRYPKASAAVPARGARWAGAVGSGERGARVVARDTLVGDVRCSNEELVAGQWVRDVGRGPAVRTRLVRTGGGSLDLRVSMRATDGNARESTPSRSRRSMLQSPRPPPRLARCSTECPAGVSTRSVALSSEPASCRPSSAGGRCTLRGPSDGGRRGARRGREGCRCQRGLRGVISVTFGALHACIR